MFKFLEYNGLFNEDPDNVGGGGGTTDDHVEDVYQDEGVDDTTTVGDAQAADPEGDDVKPADDEPVKKTLDDSALDELVKGLASRLNQPSTSAPAEAPKKQWTKEEVEKVFKPVKVTPETLAALGFEDVTDEQLKGFQAFANSIVTNATHTSNYLLQAQMEKMEQLVQPLQQHYAQQQYQQHVQEFYTEYAGLKNYPKVVQAAANLVKDVDETGKSKTVNQVKKEVAEMATSILKESGIDVSLSPQKRTPKQATHGAVPQMQQMGGTGRSQSASAGGQQNNADADIYT